MFDNGNGVEIEANSNIRRDYLTKLNRKSVESVFSRILGRAEHPIVPLLVIQLSKIYDYLSGL